MATVPAPTPTHPLTAQPGQPIVPPELTQPLIYEPTQANPAAPPMPGANGPLQYLVGTWTNQNLPGTDAGGPQSPYSYNLMILPEISPESPYGYILKSFPYYEEITFSAIHGNAPNRGGLGMQVANTLFYEQRIYVALGPARDSLIHAENGSWLFLSDSQQPLGPYGDGNGPDLGNQVVPGSTPPTQPFSLVKQMSVPHGNSILASGSFTGPQSGAPIIPAPPQVLPVGGINVDTYSTPSVGNFIPANALNPNLPLANAVAAAPPTQFIRFDVDTMNGGYPVTNIGYEQQHAKVTRYYQTLWLEAFGGTGDFTQLQYSQTIMMQIPIAGLGIVTFPHITTNTLTRVAGAALRPGADVLIAEPIAP